MSPVNRPVCGRPHGRHLDPDARVNLRQSRPIVGRNALLSTLLDEECTEGGHRRRVAWVAGQIVEFRGILAHVVDLELLHDRQALDCRRGRVRTVLVDLAVNVGGDILPPRVAPEIRIVEVATEFPLLEGSPRSGRLARPARRRHPRPRSGTRYLGQRRRHGCGRS